MLATGDVLRAALRDGTPLGLEAKAYMERGDLVPDAVIMGIARDRLSDSAFGGGVVLDGVVRTVHQAEGLRETLCALGREVDAVLYLDIQDDEIVKRLGGRVVCGSCQTPYTGRQPDEKCSQCGGLLIRRPDDEPTAVRNRLRVFQEQTAPVLDWYRKEGTRVIVVDATGTVDDVTGRILRSLGK